MYAILRASTPKAIASPTEHQQRKAPALLAALRGLLVKQPRRKRQMYCQREEKTHVMTKRMKVEAKLGSFQSTGSGGLERS
jgi:hypothetical protein